MSKLAQGKYRLRLWLKQLPWVYELARELYRVAQRTRNLWFGRPRGVLFYIGAHQGYTLSMIYPLYRCCYVFEAMPENVAILRKRFARLSDRVKIYHAAVHTYTGEATFHVSSNNVSSSLGRTFADTWQKQYPGIKMTKTIKVPCIQLMAFIEEHGVAYIDDYISDVQGMDLTILRTLEPLIRARKIGSIQCEVGLDEQPEVYEGIPGGNRKAGFEALLGSDYELVAQGKGVLESSIRLRSIGRWIASGVEGPRTAYKLHEGSWLQVGLK